MSPKDCAYIVERLAVRFMSMVAEYERKLLEHRDAFGVRTSADAKIIEGLRQQIETLNRDVRLHSLLKREYDKALMQLTRDRDTLRAEVAQHQNTESSHDTTAGKEAAASVIRDSQMTEIKVGDVVEVVSASGGQTWMADVGSMGKVRDFEPIDDCNCVRLENLPGKRNALGGYVSLCDVRKVPQ